MPTQTLWIKNGRVIDPANNRDEPGDIFAKNGKIVTSLSPEEQKQATQIDANGNIICPGLVDIHVHLRDPGQTHKENIKTGTQAAAAGGVTTVVCMPNTSPAIDNPGTIQRIQETIQRDALINVLITGTLTVGRKGEKLAPIGSLKDSGVVAVTDDGDCIQDHELMRRACEYAKMFDLPVMDHCQDASLTQGAVMHEGLVSLKNGVPGWPSAAEDIIVNRNVILSHYTGAHIHMQHLSSAYSVEILRRAKERGIRVTGEVTPHHLALTDESLLTFDPKFKMNPPLRAESDRQALIDGLLDGTIDIIATDHAPHTDYEKDVELSNAPFGITGLETLLPISLQTLYHSGKTDLSFLISRLTHKPAELLGLNKGTLSEGADADIAIINPDQTWKYEGNNIHSRSSNSPWLGTTLTGRTQHTFVAGQEVFKL